jgi:hypothetical protein
MKDICFKKKCVFRQWVGGNKYYCPFPRCFIAIERKRQEEKKNERNEQGILSKTGD